MKTRITSFSILTLVALLLTTIVAETKSFPVGVVSPAIPVQATNPPYLREMPAADRVMREIQGTDPPDTAIRQIGAYWQLIEIIKDMAWGLGHRFYGTKGQMLPDEVRIIAEYGAAYSRIWQSRPELKSQSDFIAALHGYDVDPKLRGQLLDKFFSQNFRAQYYKANARAEAEYKAWVQTRTDEAARVQAQNRAPAKANAQGTGLPPTDDPGTLAARRCIAAGRDPLQCAAEALGGGLKEFLGEIDPSLNKAEKPGLRMNGTYPGPGKFGLTFGPAAVAVTCGALVPAGHAYTVGMNGNQVLITMQNEPKPIVLAFRPDGKLVGPGSTDIKGSVVVGYKRVWKEEWRTWDNSVVPGGWVQEAIYAPKTERCNVGVLASTGAAQPGGLDALLGTKIFGATARQMANSEEIKATPGLRIIGEYTGQGGFSIEFHNESAVLACRDAVIARPYTVDSTGQVTVQHSPQPIVLTLGRDGRLTGSGVIQVAGRVVTGMSSDNQVVYAPKTDNCTLGSLSPSSNESPDNTAVETGNSPAPTGPSTDPAPIGPSTASAPTNTAGSRGNAVLSVASGFVTQPGVNNPLAGRAVILLKESFETALIKVGYQPPAGVSPIKVWSNTCVKGMRVCQNAQTAVINAYAVTFAIPDVNGKATLPPTAAGTYYLMCALIHNNQPFVWNLRITLKPGANSVTLDQRSAVQLN